jgi:hypothetical protein
MRIGCTRPHRSHDRRHADQKIALDGHYTRKDYPVHLRRVRFRDPETGKALVFLTNQTTLPALSATVRPAFSFGQASVNRPELGFQVDDQVLDRLPGPRLTQDFQRSSKHSASRDLLSGSGNKGATDSGLMQAG